LTLDSDGIEHLVEKLDKEAADIRKNALQITWHMRGGLTYDQAMALGDAERKLINAIVKEHMETTKKSGLPYF